MISRFSIAFILMTVIIDAIGIGLIMPVMPSLLQEVLPGTDLAHAAIWGGVLTTAFAVMQFLFGPVVGALSDRFGRRPVLLVSLVAMAADYVVMALAGSVWLLLAGRLFGGITAATHSTASAYMADVSSPEKRRATLASSARDSGLASRSGRCWAVSWPSSARAPRSGPPPRLRPAMRRWVPWCCRKA